MLTVYNTLAREKQVFTPIEPGRVRMYVCGMTVYDLCHIGHARMLGAFDIVYRWLHASGYAVNYVRNITDIEDKIIKRALERGITPEQLVEQTVADMHLDLAALNLLPPTHEPRATEHVAGMIEMTERLIAKGRAYAAANGDVYYAVREFPGYGKLSGKSLDDLQAGQRVEVDPHKRDPLDFVLWKAAKPGEPHWDSPWGPGRPGWHIECSVMSEHHLGSHFDIHGGGEDLQFPHHENEIAQSEGCHDHTYVNYWLHNGFLQFAGEKMSKSLGNFFTIRDVLRQFDGEAVRFLIVRAHYRSPLNYSEELLRDAKHALDRLYTALRHTPPAGRAAVDWDSPHGRRFKAAMDDDFNTPEAVAVLFELAAEVNRSGSAELAGQLKGLAGILGLLQRDPVEYLQAGPSAGGEGEYSAERIEALIVARTEARKARDFAESDRIRKELADHGVVLEDGPQGTTWRRE
ncbi:cysteine--tRNA ligase [Chitinimonas koreensis]|uniref:cysteine--tRNA ligase n=1 Tax=Chitinimonas koreensis TaxID=356302 RepID=UPI0003F88240|nr:cysteine--tRNA ligase [Chitinimonas koreensis]QNM95225.1 cysteine--tRNA ligase [Chitinimonas koreensis]